jgi:hypothetical protein
MEHSLSETRAYKVVEEFIKNGRKLDEDDLFYEAYLKYQTGKHRSPANIKHKLRQSIIIITNKLT